MTEHWIVPNKTFYTVDTALNHGEVVVYANKAYPVLRLTKRGAFVVCEDGVEREGYFGSECRLLSPLEMLAWSLNSDDLV